MSITFQLPEDLEVDLRRQVSNIDQEAKELFLVDLYKRERITRVQLSNALGMDKLQTDGFLKRHGVTEDLLTIADYEEDLARLKVSLNASLAQSRASR